MGVGMNSGGWRYIAASVVGTSHTKVGGACQDSNDCQLHQLSSGDNILVAVVSDGAGSAKFGGEGAALACSVFLDLVADHISGGHSVEQVSIESARFWLDVLKTRLSSQAESVSQPLREFACTLLGAIVADSCSAFIQIGDGAIVVADSEESEYGHIFWPDRGEYENTTHFITEESVDSHLRFEFVRRQIVEVALFSDGLQRLALDYRSQTAHRPFFEGLFRPLRKASEGRSEELTQFLVEFLSSARVSAKTDDDKTLVLATKLQDQVVEGV
jgi:hypothetical protein